MHGNLWKDFFQFLYVLMLNIHFVENKVVLLNKSKFLSFQQKKIIGKKKTKNEIFYIILFSNKINKNLTKNI